MTIGRADAADIQIDNDFLSRVHARIVSTPTGVAIEDVESKNGIRVNAKDVKRKELRHGDIIDVGRLRFRFIDIARDDAD
jgi:pSer/pThr/pTyr-binding forkhead associated (FHA) protein